MKKLNEKEILNLIISKIGKNNIDSSFGKDDISLIPLKDLIKSSKNCSLAITSDMLVEHTDVPSKMNFIQIARKSVVSCISDLSAKGIRPVIALVSLGIPTYLTKSNIDELINGFLFSSREFGFFITGGDINESKELVIDCCMLGFSNNSNRVPRRNGSLESDYVVVSGSFGYTSSGLKILMDNLKTPDNEFRESSIDSVLNPSPCFEFGLNLSKYLSSSIDSSDGLASSLYELAKESQVDLIIEEEKIPIPPGLQKFASINGLNLEDLVFYGGEEYHIVGTISKKNLLKLSKLAEDHKLKYYVIGEVVKGFGKVFLISPDNKRRLLKNKGYIHLP
jgi:thiamine-monophosphate kinase